MEQVFGAVTPFTIMMVVTLLTQFVKANFCLTSRQVQFVALGFSALLIVAYETIAAWPALTPMGVFSSFIFALLGWFAAIGMYEVATKQLTRGSQP